MHHTRHGETDFGNLGYSAGKFFDDAAAINNQDTVGERHHLVELGRNDQRADPCVPGGDDPLMDIFDRADIDATGRLTGDDQLNVAL